MKRKNKLLIFKFLISLLVLFPMTFIMSLVLFESLTSICFISLVSIVLSVGHTFIPNDEEDLKEETKMEIQEEIKKEASKIEEVPSNNKIKQLEKVTEDFIEEKEFIKIKIKQY